MSERERSRDFLPNGIDHDCFELIRDFREKRSDLFHQSIDTRFIAGLIKSQRRSIDDLERVSTDLQECGDRQGGNRSIGIGDQCFEIGVARRHLCWIVNRDLIQRSNSSIARD